jgi:hypothetical protein
MPYWPGGGGFLRLMPRGWMAERHGGWIRRSRTEATPGLVAVSENSTGAAVPRASHSGPMKEL